ncbi:MAG: hydroxymethylglutaryl-CoA reductase [Alphaproteobacteria bacterium]|nr:hydroxymethylglutaryl-CoA reductase [Alphaproteobacteria bacterium]MBT5389090.1 hydroxymethylglutaryl-CoA reductase [Alphaproteobacteria bacterium]MBT5540269.1 hydroxymethylglutaryl-CoA reductase [Alphaproteobacteria bacterium]MBT5654614.1 hydroxymethylglutaryl-CoA reductase [Alphaproteobacteria bacterium]
MKKFNESSNIMSIPMEWVGPIKIIGNTLSEEVTVPLATFETPLFRSTYRGAKVTTLAGGIQVSLVSEGMTRSILLEAATVKEVLSSLHQIQERFDDLKAIVAQTGRFVRLVEMTPQVVGNLLYLRLKMETGDASGHNMVTKAADALCQWICNEYNQLKYVSVSGNVCADKKVSAVNGLLGRGKYVVADCLIPGRLCQRILKTSPEDIVQLNIKKNLMGSIVAGGVRTANAHFANLLLAFYLATGQDAANIVEGSQGMVHCEVRGGDLYFSVTLPNLIVGTVGNGKHLPLVQENLEKLGCLIEREVGENARRLACICASSVLCAELSLLAAQTNQGQLMESHLRIERQEQRQVS